MTMNFKPPNFVIFPSQIPTSATFKPCQHIHQFYTHLINRILIEIRDEIAQHIPMRRLNQTRPLPYPKLQAPGKRILISL